MSSCDTWAPDSVCSVPVSALPTPAAAAFSVSLFTSVNFDRKSKLFLWFLKRLKFLIRVQFFTYSYLISIQ